jgi:NAD(P)-dependent dehydrogenase (short-subunit alcohol dehydrogenase family)
MPKPAWLITGCSTGFGKVLAMRLAELGYRVCATARNVDSLNEIVEVSPENVLALTLDVNDQSQVDAAINQMVKKFGSIDVFANNAGFGLIGGVEECSLDEIRHQFETNVFGAIRMIQAVLPQMRGQGSGVILNLSSIAGIEAFPGSGYYAATKHALEAINRSLRLETAPFGIKVVAINPGPFRTDFHGRSLVLGKNRMPEYEDVVGKRRDGFADFAGKQPGDPHKAADAMIQVAEHENPPQRLFLGQMAYDLAHEAMHRMQTELEDWRDVTLSADFPG